MLSCYFYMPYTTISTDSKPVHILFMANKICMIGVSFRSSRDRFPIVCH